MNSIQNENGEWVEATPISYQPNLFLRLYYWIKGKKHSREEVKENETSGED